MRKILRAAGALLLALALLCGCAPQAAEDTPPIQSAPPAQQPEAPPAAALPEAEPQGFGLAYESEAGINPYSCRSLCNRAVLSLLYEPLFTVDADFNAAPYLCQSYSASGDGRTHTLVLREDVTFADGSPLTADDAAASIQAAQSSAYYGRRLRLVSSVRADDAHTLTITTDAACGTLPALLNIYVVKAGTADAAIPVGTGPYRMGQGALLRGEWWRAATPSVQADVVSLVEAAGAANIRDAFEYGQITLAIADPNVGARIAYHADFELWNSNTTVMQYVGFNLNSTVFSNETIRAAVTYGIDRDALAAGTAGGFAAAAVLPASPYARVYDQRLADNYAYNPTALSETLTAAGFSAEAPAGEGEDGEEAEPAAVMLVCSASDQRVAAAQAIVDALNGQGFRLGLRALPYDDYLSALEQGNFDLYYGEVRLPPDFDLSVFFDASGALSFGSIADSTLAQLCDMATENAGNTYDLHEQIMARGLLCPVLFKTYAVYTARGRVTNLTPCLDGVFLKPIT